MTNAWEGWLSSIPEDQQKLLLSTLKQRYPNGQSAQTPLATPSDASDVLVTRTSSSDLLITETPPYLDIFNLHPLYDQIAFHKNLLIKGPKGVAKSLSIFAWAKEHMIPLVVQECSESTKDQHLLGSQTLLGGKTVFVLGSIPTAIDVANEYGKCILLFEEVNALTPQTQKMLNAVADFRKACSLPVIKRSYQLRKGAQLWVSGTMNPSVYGGTYDLNEDFKGRCNEIDVTYPANGPEKMILKALVPQAADDVVDKVLRFGAESRQQETSYALATRDLARFLDDIQLVGLQKALQMVVCKFEGEDRDTALKRASSIFGNTGIKKYWGGAS